MDTTLKQRLIGAVVLIALAVIFLPMLVQGPAPDSGVADVSLRVPDAPAGQYETRELPLAGPAAEPGAPVPQASTPEVASDPVAATPAAAEPAVASGDWAVSFGAYSSQKDANDVLARLVRAGLQGFIEPDELNGRKVWRVRVGPYADRALAEAGRLQAIRIRDDVKAQVIALNADAQASDPAVATSSQAQAAPAAAPVRSQALPADPPAPSTRTTTTASTQAAAPARASTTPAPAAATTAPAAATAPAASGVGFAVQMGAFAREADAIALRDKLRAAGFSALVQPVRTDKGVLNRVRVGPVLSREEATQLKSRLASRFGEGNVVTHP